MKQGWEVLKLGNVLQRTETTNPAIAPNREFDYIDVSSVNNKDFYIEKTSRLKGAEAPSRARKLVKTGDVIFATVRPTLKRIAIIPKELDGQVCSTGYFVLRSNGIILNRLLYYYLLSDSFIEIMEKLQKGASYPAVTDNEVRDQFIQFPKSLPEQQRIVTILDEAFAAIATAKANVEKNLQNARELYETVVQNIFTDPNEKWGEKSLGEVFDIARGGSPRPIASYLTNSPDGINWIKIGDTKGITKYISRTEEKIKPEGARRSRIVHEGDFILSNSMSFGRPYIMKTTGCIHDGWLVLSEKEKNVDKDYLYHILGSRLIFQQFDRLAAGSTVRNLNIDLVKKVKIPLPSLNHQKRIVEKLERILLEISNLETQYKKKLIELEELKKSILQKAFNGELSGA